MIGEDPNGMPNNLIPFVTKVAKGQLEKLSVFGNDYDTIDGKGVRGISRPALPMPVKQRKN